MRYYVCKTGCKASPDLQQFLTFELQENMRDNQTYIRMFLCNFRRYIIYNANDDPLALLHY